MRPFSLDFRGISPPARRRPAAGRGRLPLPGRGPRPVPRRQHHRAVPVFHLRRTVSHHALSGVETGVPQRRHQRRHGASGGAGRFQTRFWTRSRRRHDQLRHERRRLRQVRSRTGNKSLRREDGEDAEDGEGRQGPRRADVAQRRRSAQGRPCKIYLSRRRSSSTPR